MRQSGSSYFIKMPQLTPPTNHITKTMAFVHPYKTYLKENDLIIGPKITHNYQPHVINESSSSTSQESKGYVPKKNYYANSKSLLKKQKEHFRTKTIQQSDNGNEVSYVESMEKTDQEKVCNCRQSNCLKKYCQCFKSGDKCSSKCRCIDCKNTDGLIQVTKTVQISCNCKKSECEKKYCECLNSGKKCSPLCNCIQCKNQPDTQLSSFKHGKKKRQQN